MKKKFAKNVVFYVHVLYTYPMSTLGVIHTLYDNHVQYMYHLITVPVKNTHRHHVRHPTLTKHIIYIAIFNFLVLDGLVL